jgi:hypothetical protein
LFFLRGDVEGVKTSILLIITKWHYLTPAA